MKKFRTDGYYVKDANPYLKLMGHIMPHRYDAQNFATLQIRCDAIDEFISSQSKLGNNYTFVDVILAGLVRTLAMRPHLNRFVKNRRIYQHNDIAIAFVVKKALTDEGDETTVKVHFSGSETIQEIRQKVQDEVAKCTSQQDSETDKFTKVLSASPHWFMRLAVNFFNWMDNHNLLSKDLVELSPFHNSAFVTFLRSIKGPAINHHCYDFGTTGLFLAVGKERVEPVVECGKLTTARVMELGITMDDRVCDGMYYVNSMRVIQNLFNDPSVLLGSYDVTKAKGYVAPPLTRKQKRVQRRQQKRQRKAQPKD